MSKIIAYIQEHNLKPSECVYHTWRTLKNKAGKPCGKIRVLVPQNSLARVEYECPECGHEAYIEKEWKRPFSVTCEKCNFRIRAPKMKDQAKKEVKAEVAKRN
jgi:DNA-directed RNA polymerase subunit RPC12/RpoP